MRVKSVCEGARGAMELIWDKLYKVAILAQQHKHMDETHV